MKEPYEINFADSTQMKWRTIGYGIVVGLFALSAGALLSLTVVLAIIGVPLMIGAFFAPILALVHWKSRVAKCRKCNHRILFMKAHDYTDVCRSCKSVNKLVSA